MPAIDPFLAQWRRSIDSLITLADQLTDAQWALPGGCAGWSVQDVFAHIIGGERWLALSDTVPGFEGEPDPVALDGWPDRPVLARRGESPAALVEELRHVGARRITELAEEPPAPFRRAVTPWGAPTTLARLLTLRAFDVWAHLFDIRRVLGMSTPRDPQGRALMTAALAATVRDVPPGSRVRLTVLGGVPLDATVEFPTSNQRGPRKHRFAPAAHLTAEWDIYARLACGLPPAHPQAAWVSGDEPVVQVLRKQLFTRNNGFVSSGNVGFPSHVHGYVCAMPHHTVRPKLGIVSTYIPRRCGLANYTADFRKSLSVATDDLETVVVAIDRDGLHYGDEVVATIRQDVVDDYTAAAQALHAAGVDVVLIQHEYGIFGGPNGAHVLALTRALAERDIPYLLTLHTVLSRPTPGQAATLRALCSRAARITVFTETARRIVVRTGVAPGHQISVLPHGAPVELQDPPPVETLRADLAELLTHLKGKPTLTTFGLISPGKGIDVAIDALATVVERHPDAQYVVAGSTHPEIVRQVGEEYRERLHAQVDRLGLTDRVHFVDAFLTEREISGLLGHTTLYVTPYRSPEQICSGALTFGLAAGCPAVSSAYRYAEDMLRGGAGRLVPCGDADALAGEILALLDDPAALAEARVAARSIGARITWPAVAVRAAALVREVLAESAAARAGAGFGSSQPLGVTPPLRLAHLDRITDEIGIIQFAKGSEPDHASGYCIDDVARLAIVASDLLTTGRDARRAERWIRLCMRFLSAAYEPGSDGMHNLLSYSGTWQDWPHRGDHVGRAMWALGAVAANPACAADARDTASALLSTLTPSAERLADLGLRAAAYALLGLAQAGRPAAEVEPLVRRLDAALLATSAHDSDWYWFEPELTYDNARLAQALLAGAARLGDEAVAARAVDALDWYVRHVGLTTGTLRNVGNRWHHRDDPVAWAQDGDEQPLDAAACVEALVEVWQQTRDPRYARLAGWAYAWFLGRNRAGARLYADTTGGCKDGLSATGPNENQGAESTLAYYQALLSLVGAGLATLPDRVSVEGVQERHVLVNRSSVADRPMMGPAVAPATTTAATVTPTRPGKRKRTTESPTDA